MEKIYLIPIGDVDEKILLRLKSPIEEQFGFPCVAGNGVGMPDHAYSSARRQYYSTAVLRELRAKLPEDAVRVLGIADVDLYVPQLNFVFGEADQLVGVAVISLCRLRQEFYGLKPDKKLFQERAVKEAVHELGHTFGLGHCRDPNCVMYFSNSLLDTDRKGKGFCALCQRKLRAQLKR